MIGLVYKKKMTATRMVIAHAAVVICLITQFAGCGYLNMISQKKSLEAKIKTSPSLVLDKELNPERCFTVYGLVSSIRPFSHSVAIVAISFQYNKQELVDYHFLRSEGYYSLFLPEGKYVVYAFTDINDNGTFETGECSGVYEKELVLNDTLHFSRIVGNVNIQLSSRSTNANLKTFDLKVQPVTAEINTAPYPSGALRSLDDPLFSRDTALEGVFSPSRFLERSPIYFYAISPFNEKKIPIVCVHGYSGYPQEFKEFVKTMDTAKYQIWFFYYPSGQRLDRSGEVFYELFLSGNIIQLRQNRLIIFAHSMGGLVARHGLNIYSRRKHSDARIDYISACTPYGGNAGAESGVKNMPVVVPSWHDLSQQSSFIKNLNSEILSSNVRFYLFFSYKGTGVVKTGENSDGTIALTSQLHHPAQMAALRIIGFNETHESILFSERMFEEFNRVID